MKKLVLIDGNALVHRAFHALPALKAPSGMITNAVFGFSSILIKAIKDIKPDYMAAAFDLAGPTFRHEEYEDYKGHRERAPNELYMQMPIVKNVLNAFGVPVFEKEGYEADDIIGTLAAKGAKEKNLQVIILTGDLDTLQLVQNKKVMVYTPRKGLTDTVIYDEEMVKERYEGLVPGQMTDFKGLKGDPSDNIPGVPGVGEKTALALIKKFGSIEKMYKELENPRKKIEGISPKLKGKLLESKEQAMFSKHLSIIVTNMDIDFFSAEADWKRNFNRPALEGLFRELAFTSLINRVSDIINGAESELVSGDQNALKSKAPRIVERADAEEIIRQAKKKKFLALQIDGDMAYVSFDPEVSYGLKVGDIKEVLEDERVEKIMHDAKPAVKFLMRKSITARNIFDTALAEFLLSPDQKDYAFPEVYFQEFHHSPYGEGIYVPCQLIELKDTLWEKLKSQNLINIFEKIETPLISVLARMEEHGIRVDTKVVSKLGQVVKKELSVLEKKIYKEAKKEFNINSPSQLSAILFEELGLKGKVRKTGGGAKSTAASELEKLADEHPIVDLVLQYRELQKIKTTYIEPFPKLVDKESRIHTTYNQMGAGTGRISSENPNLQNIPMRTELGRQFRKSFVAEKNHILLSLDYSQIELRIAAHVSGDKTMIDAFKKGEDIHTRTAAEVFDVMPMQVTQDMRRKAKVINFGVLYGMGVLGFARRVGVDRVAAKNFIDKYFKEFPGLAKYMEKMKSEVRRKGFVTTIFGRRRQINEVFTTMLDVQRQGERMAINFPIQGGAADVMKMAMLEADNYVQGLKNNARLLLQVHDELVLEVRENKVTDVGKDLKEIMQNVVELKVPLVVEVKVGRNWAEMTRIS